MYPYLMRMTNQEEGPVNQALAELFKHNLWANLRLLDACASLSDEQLDADATGTYGRVRDTLVHLVAAEGRYVARLTGRQPDQALRESDGFPGFEELRKRAQGSGEELIEIARGFRPKVLKGTWRGEPYAIPATTIIIQAINHATEHRAHVMTILSQQGIEPPSLDGWTYGEEGQR